MAVVEVRGLRKTYGDVEAVRDVTFAVEAGQVFAMLGPNGAGKTTTTEILEGYRRRTAGEVSVLGVDPAHAGRGWRDRIGIVLQSCGLGENLTVAETVEMYGSYYSRRRPVGELLDLVELDAKRDARIGTLSGGQRRRVDLALALAGDPELLFLDEPTTGFDPGARRGAWQMVRNLRALGKTVFLTTHYMDEAQELADRIVVVANGTVVASGTPAEIGGRNELPTVIRFPLPAGYALADLPDLGAAEVTEAAGVVAVRTTTNVETAHRITGWALENGVALPGLSVSQPTLEDVYLALTSEGPA